jgi:pantothenate kinase
VKDPTPDSIGITPRHRVVLIEGLYTLLSVEPWRQAAELLDERWIIRVDLTQARQRLVKRHVVTGVTSDWEEGYRRSEENDMPSEWCGVAHRPSEYDFSLDGRFVLENVLAPTRTIDSVEDPLLALP